MNDIYAHPVLTSSKKDNERSIKIEILSRLINNKDIKNTVKDLIKLVIFELQNILFIIEISYTNMFCGDIDMININGIGAFPYKLSKFFNLSFIMQHDCNNILLDMDQMYHIILIIIVLSLCTIYLTLSIYIMLTSLSYSPKEDIHRHRNIHHSDINENIHCTSINNYMQNCKYNTTSNTNNNTCITRIRIKFLKFLQENHIFIISYYILIWCIYIIQYIILTYNEYSISIYTLITLLILVSIVMIMNLILCIGILKYCTHILTNNVLLNLRNQNGIYIVLIFRILIPLAYFSINHIIQDIIIFLMIILFIVIRFIFVIFKYPTYYNIKQLKITSLFIASSLSIILAWIVSKSLYQCNNPQGSLMMSSCIVLFCPLLAKYILVLQDHLINRMINLPLSKLKDEEVISRFIYFSTTIIETPVPPYEEKEITIMNIILKGKLHRHLKECENCEFIKDILEVINNPIIFGLESYKRVRVHVLQCLLENGLQQNPKSSKLYLLLTEFIIDNDKGFQKGIAMIEKAKGLILSPHYLLSCNILKLKLMEKINKFNQNRKLDIDQLLICDKLEQEIFIKLKSQANHHLMFWKILEEFNDIDMDMIIKLSSTIENEFKKIEANWVIEETIYTKSLYLKPLFLYGLFLQAIKHDIYRSDAILKKYYQFRAKLNHFDKINVITNFNICSEKNVSIKANINKSQLDDIFWCSKSINDLLGYTRQEIIGRRKVEVIMPEYLKPLHARFVINYFKTGKQKMLNGIKDTYAQHKLGYLVPVYVFATVYPYSIHGLHIAALIRENQIPYDIVLTSLSGYIINMTKDIMLDWQMSCEQFNKVLIWELCSTLRRVIFAFQIIIKKKMGINRKTRKSIVKSLDELSSNKDISDEFIDMSELRAQKLVDKYSIDGSVVRFEIHKSVNGNNELTVIEYSLLIKTETYDTNECLLKLMLKKMRIYKKASPKSLNNKISLGIFEYKMRTNSIFKSIKSIPDIDESFNENLSESYESYAIDSRCLMQNTLSPKFLSSTTKNYNSVERNKYLENKLELNIQTTYYNQTSELKKPKIVSFFNQNENFDDIKENEIQENHSEKKSYFGEKSSIHTRSSELKKVHNRVHQALEASYQPKLLNYQLILVPLFLLSTIVLMIGAELLGQSVSAQGLNYITIINTANQRCLIDIELYKMSRILWMIKTNYVDDKHFCYLNLDDCQNLLSSQLTSIFSTAEFLLRNTTRVMEAISDFDPSLQKKFYNYQIKLCNTETNGILTDLCFIMDQFRAVNAIYDRAIQLSRLDFQNVTQNDTDLNYLLGNLLGDLGIALQNTSFQISKNMNTLLGQVKALAYYILEIFVPLCALIWIVIIITSMHMYVNNKRIFLNVASLPGKYSHSQVLKVRNFIKRLKHESHNDSDKIDTKLSTNRNLTVTSSERHQSIFTRNIRMRKYCLGYVIRFGLLFISIILVMLIFLLRLVHRTEINEDRTIPLAAIDKSTKQIYYQSLSIAYLYEYIISNGSSIVMDKNISSALDLSINNISSQQDFSTLFRFRQGAHDPLIDYILFHNACDILPQTIPNYNYCSIIGSGPSQRGLINLNTYAYQTISSIKDDFDKSMKSTSDMRKVLNQQALLDLQIISYSFIPYYYNYIYELLYLRFKNATNDITNTGYIWIGTCTFCIIIIYWVILIPTIDSLLKEINNVKKVMKIIPKEYILSNNILRKFVIATSNHKSSR